MKKLLSLSIFLLAAFNAQAQNVGIGTSTPTQRLDVNGRMRLRHTPNNTSGVWLNKSDNTDASFVGQVNDSTFGIWDAPTSSWRFALNHSNSWMGIGTATPRFPLAFANTVGDKISLWGGSTSPTANHYGLGIQGSLLQLFTPTASDDIAFGTGRSGSFSENVRITGDGKLGIGTPNPSASLTVNGNVRITDGTQGMGKVLTSDANGNTSWRTQAYANQERFMVKFSATSNGGFSLPTYNYTIQYNTGTNSISNGRITITKPGLYHFEGNINCTVSGGPDISANGSDPSYAYMGINASGVGGNPPIPSGAFFIANNIPFTKVIYSGPFAPPTDYRCSAKAEMDLYLFAGQVVFLDFSVFGTTTGYFSGYLISE